MDYQKTKKRLDEQKQDLLRKLVNTNLTKEEHQRLLNSVDIYDYIIELTDITILNEETYIKDTRGGFYPYCPQGSKIFNLKRDPTKISLIKVKNPKMEFTRGSLSLVARLFGG